MKILKPSAIAISLIGVVLSCNNPFVKDQLETDNTKVEEISLAEMEAPQSPGQIRDQIEKNYQSDTIQLPGQAQKILHGIKNNQASTPDWDKKIIKNAFINIEVKDYKVFNTAIREKTRLLGGYIAMEEQGHSEYKIENVMTIKVPVDQFDNAVSEFTIGSEKLIEKKITSEDVTSQVVDTKSRLEAKKQIRIRYLDLLKLAKNMEEILNVQQEINGIQEDIESASGRLQYLGNASRYSTIHLTCFQVLDPSAKNINELRFGTKLWTSFRNGWHWVGEVLIGIITIWPLFVIGFICWIIYRRTRAPKKVENTNYAN